MWALWNAVLLVAICSANGEAPPRVTSPAGTFIGQLVNTPDGSYRQFRGIPYAEPPTGELRFRPTVAKVGKLDGEYNATSFRSFCVQLNMFPSQAAFGQGTEDCLYLNVYAPPQDGKLKPVLVFLHGGGNLNGMSDIYTPGQLVVRTDIVAVTVNYRLGILGFLSTLTEASPGNYGMWDQITALRWVQDNIRSFGGDPTQVTLSGESAGAIDTSFLTLSPEAKGLFARSWSMSGVTGVRHTTVSGSADATLTMARNVARREKCVPEDTTDADIASQWSSVVECLRSVPEDKFQSLQGLGEMPFLGPVIDGDLLPLPVKDMVADHDYLTSIGFTARDYLVSVCYNEGDLFNAIQAMAKELMTPDQLEAIPEDAMWHGLIGALLGNVFGPLSPDAIQHIAQFYEENYEINPIADFGADTIFHIPGLEYSNAVSEALSDPTKDTYMLRFVNFPEFQAGPYKGTLHAVDLLYLFDFGSGEDLEVLNTVVDYKIDGSKWTKEDEDLKRKYIDLAGTFVRNGKPSVSGVNWPAYTEEGGHYLEFGSFPKVQSHLKAERLEFFNHVIPRWIEEHPLPVEDQPSSHAQDEL